MSVICFDAPILQFISKKMQEAVLRGDSNGLESCKLAYTTNVYRENLVFANLGYPMKEEIDARILLLIQDAENGLLE